VLLCGSNGGGSAAGAAPAAAKDKKKTPNVVEGLFMARRIMGGRITASHDFVFAYS
jgi:hypothetical protein